MPEVYPRRVARPERDAVVAAPTAIGQDVSPSGRPGGRRRARDRSRGAPARARAARADRHRRCSSSRRLAPAAPVPRRATRPRSRRRRHRPRLLGSGCRSTRPGDPCPAAGAPGFVDAGGSIAPETVPVPFPPLLAGLASGCLGPGATGADDCPAALRSYRSPVGLARSRCASALESFAPAVAAGIAAPELARKPNEPTAGRAVSRRPAMPRVVNVAASGRANPVGLPMPARRRRQGDGASLAACSGARVKERGRTGAGRAVVAAVIATRSACRAAQSGQAARRASASDRAAPVRSSAASAAMSSVSWAAWDVRVSGEGVDGVTERGRLSLCSGSIAAVVARPPTRDRNEDQHRDADQERRHGEHRERRYASVRR